MEVTIKGEPKEIAALVLELQGRRGTQSEDTAIRFPLIDSPDAYAHNLVAKNNNVTDP